jgi:uncharacterized membrane protein
MANSDSVAGTGPTLVLPGIRKIGPADLKEVLAKGLEDFKAKPSHIVLLVVLYPIVGLFLIRLSAGYDVLPLIFPLVAGFALIGPLAALGLYELSRRMEEGIDANWRHAFDILHAPSLRAIVTLSIIMMAIYFAWLAAALAIFEYFFPGWEPLAVSDFLLQVFTSPSGWRLIVVGCGVGFLFAVVVLAVSVVSFPMLLDRKVSAWTAIQTSIRAVAANPVAMAMWGFIVAVLLFIGSLPFLFGLSVVMPVIGHATWHLYRKVVER